MQSDCGDIGVLVNNAARDDRHSIESVTVDFWDERIAVNLRHQFFAAQAVVDQMKRLGGGSIINFGSISWMTATGGMPAYTTSKAAIHGLTRGLARDLGPYNIRANTVSPGWVMTERQLKMWVTPESETRLDQLQCLKGRLQPEDVAENRAAQIVDDSLAQAHHEIKAQPGGERQRHGDGEHAGEGLIERAGLAAREAAVDHVHDPQPEGEPAGRCHHQRRERSGDAGAVREQKARKLAQGARAVQPAPRAPRTRPWKGSRGCSRLRRKPSGGRARGARRAPRAAARRGGALPQ